jgi:hypothetical protein
VWLIRSFVRSGDFDEGDMVSDPETCAPAEHLQVRCPRHRQREIANHRTRLPAWWAQEDGRVRRGIFLISAVAAACCARGMWGPSMVEAHSVRREGAQEVLEKRRGASTSLYHGPASDWQNRQPRPGWTRRAVRRVTGAR